MKTLGLLAVISVVASSALAQDSHVNELNESGIAQRNPRIQKASTGPRKLADSNSAQNAAVFAISATAKEVIHSAGLYVKAGAGFAQVTAGGFTKTTSYGETLKNKETKDLVAVATIEVGFQFNENWDLGLRFTDYSTAQIKMDHPKFTGLASIVPFPAYSRHVFHYDTTRVALVPSYTFAAGDRMRLRAGLGVACSQTRSHFEADYYIQYSGRPSEWRYEAYPEAKKTNWNFNASLGAEWIFTSHLSLELTVAYSPYNIQIPATQIAYSGPTRPSTSSVKIEAVEAAISFVFRK